MGEKIKKKQSSKVNTLSYTVKNIIKQLKSGELMIKDIPEEFALDMNIIRAQRKLGLRESCYRGFDVIRQEFFVEEEWMRKESCFNLFDRDNKITFESFEEYYNFLDGDIYEDSCYYQYDFNDNFSKMLNLDIDRLTKKKYFVSETIDDYKYESSQYEKNDYLDYKVQKAYKNEMFVVKQFWYDKTGKIIDRYYHKFDYFFDFVAFLKGDLSEADLILCSGIKNLTNIEGINLENTKLTSSFCDLFGISYNLYNYNKKFISEFSLVEKNEKQTTSILELIRDDDFNNSNDRICYISDLHLMHKINNAGCKSEEDIICVIRQVAENIVNESSKLILIGGDISSEFSIFELFVKTLRKTLDDYYESFYNKKDVVFVLGNHELWQFSQLSLEEIVKKYRQLLSNYDMYLLHNDLFYKNESYKMGVIPYDKLCNLDNESILEKLRCSRFVILGGIGFSGYNEEFNANNGIYRNVIDRNTEIKESKKFENLYNKLCDVLDKRNTIILTHMPKKDWCIDESYHENFVYVSGHTHRNIFFDNGEERVYADNQIGYKNQNPHLKSFLIDTEYDYFFDYEDGIYEITPQEYKDFIRGKNIQMRFTRKIHILYMLKKNGYYCFIHKTKTGSLLILNGGAVRKLNVKDIQYYYDNMNMMISNIKNPLDKYTTYQENIANEIKKIGGSGKIHGCIIDIDFYNHVYVNPVDMTITGYWASNIINKVVYPNIPALLKDNCYELYLNYLKLIDNGNSNNLILRREKNEINLLQQTYLETDIYKASREVKKMQKLSSYILTMWYENISDNNALPYKK